MEDLEDAETLGSVWSLGDLFLSMVLLWNKKSNLSNSIDASFLFINYSLNFFKRISPSLP